MRRLAKVKAIESALHAGPKTRAREGPQETSHEQPHPVPRPSPTRWPRSSSTASRSGSTSSAAASSRSGELERLVDEDGLGGVTSNPAIFEKAIDGSNDYATAIDEISEGRPACAPRTSTSGWPWRTSRTRPTCCAPVYDRTKAQRRLREPRGLARPGQRHRGHARRGAPPLEGGGPAQRDDQGPGDARGPPRHPHADRRGHQRQRHAALRPRAPTRRWPRPTSRASRRGRQGPAPRPAWRASPASS